VRFNGRMRLAPAYRVCVVCTGNICRSPMADVILRSMLLSAGLEDRVVVDSAGTDGWHDGDAADPRTVSALQQQGYDGTHHRAREFRRACRGVVEHLRAELTQRSGPADGHR